MAIKILVENIEEFEKTKKIVEKLDSCDFMYKFKQVECISGNKGLFTNDKYLFTSDYDCLKHDTLGIPAIIRVTKTQFTTSPRENYNTNEYLLKIEGFIKKENDEQEDISVEIMIDKVTNPCIGIFFLK